MTLSETVKAAFEKAFPGEDFSGIRVVPATDPRFGDYQCNDALKIAKKVGLKPRDAAQKVADLLSGGCFDKVEVAGPGFLNLTVSCDWLNSQLAALASRPLCGIRSPARARRSSSTTPRPTPPSRCTSATSARRSSAAR